MPAGRRGSRVARLLAWLAVAVVAAAGVAAVVALVWLPGWLKGKLERDLSAALGCVVTVERVRVEPFSLAAVVEGGRVISPGGAELLVWRRLRVDASAATLWRDGVVLDAVEWDSPTAEVKRDKGGRVEWLEILKGDLRKAGEAAAEAATPVVHVSRLSVTGASVAWTDHVPEEPVVMNLGPVTVSLDHLAFSGRTAERASVRVETDAGELLEADVALELLPVRVRGRVAVTGLDLPAYAPYVPASVPLRPVRGRLDAVAELEVDLEPGAQAVLIDRARLEVRDLATEAGGAGPGPSARLLVLDGVTLDAVTPAAIVGSLEADGLNVPVRRLADGGVVVGGWGMAAERFRGDAETGPPRWPDVRVESVLVTDSTVEWTDEATGAAPASVALEAVSVSGRGWSLDEGASFPVKLDGVWRGGGDVEVAATVEPRRRAVDAAVKIEGMDLAPLLPYAAGAGGVTELKGAVSVQATAGWAAADGGSGGVADLAGDVEVRALLVRKGAPATQVPPDYLVAGPRFEARGVRVSTDPRSVVVERVVLDQPMFITSPGISAGTWDAREPRGDAGGGGSGAGPTGWSVRVGGVDASGMMLVWLDSTQGSTVHLPLSVQRAVLGAMDTDVATAASFELKGLWPRAMGPATIPLGPRYGDFEIRGTGNLLHPGVPLEVELVGRDLDLVRLDPYISRHLGYSLTEGLAEVRSRLSLTGRDLSLENHIELKPFVLGERVPSPEASDLPVALAVSLLRDRSGRIVLDLPVRGNLDDPQFSTSRVLWRGVQSLVTNVALAPLKILAALVPKADGAPDATARAIDATVRFAAGAVEPDPTELEELEALAAALAERPSVRVVLSAVQDAAVDAVVIRAEEVERLVRGRAWESRMAEDPATPALDAFVPTEDERLRALARLVAELSLDGGSSGVTEPETASPGSATVDGDEASPGTEPVRKRWNLFGWLGRVLGIRRADPAVGAESGPAEPSRDRAPEIPRRGGPAEGGSSWPPSEADVERWRHLLAERVEVTPQGLRKLTLQRLRAVQRLLSASPDVAPEQVLLDPGPPAAGPAAVVLRVDVREVSP